MKTCIVAVLILGLIAPIFSQSTNIFGQIGSFITGYPLLALSFAGPFIGSSNLGRNPSGIIVPPPPPFISGRGRFIRARLPRPFIGPFPPHPGMFYGKSEMKE